MFNFSINIWGVDVLESVVASTVLKPGVTIETLGQQGGNKTIKLEPQEEDENGDVVLLSSNVVLSTGPVSVTITA